MEAPPSCIYVGRFRPSAALFGSRVYAEQLTSLVDYFKRENDCSSLLLCLDPDVDRRKIIEYANTLTRNVLPTKIVDMPKKFVNMNEDEVKEVLNV